MGQGLCLGAELPDERELSTLTRLACGALAGTTGQTVAYPLDVVRRRMQVRLSHSCFSEPDWPRPGCAHRPHTGSCSAAILSATSCCPADPAPVTPLATDNMLILEPIFEQDGKEIMHACVCAAERAVGRLCPRRCLAGRGRRRCMQRGAQQWPTQA